MVSRSTINDPRDAAEDLELKHVVLEYLKSKNVVTEDMQAEDMRQKTTKQANIIDKESKEDNETKMITTTNVQTNSRSNSM